MKKNKKNIAGNWVRYSDYDDYTNWHAFSMTFDEDGTFYAQTWRTKFKGQYSLDNENIYVNASVYWNGAGSMSYEYYGEQAFCFRYNDDVISEVWHDYGDGNRIASDDTNDFYKTDVFMNFWN